MDSAVVSKRGTPVYWQARNILVHVAIRQHMHVAAAPTPTLRSLAIEAYRDAVRDIALFDAAYGGEPELGMVPPL